MRQGGTECVRTSPHVSLRRHRTVDNARTGNHPVLGHRGGLGCRFLDDGHGVAATFLPAGEGWILSGYHCSTGVCLAVKRTMDGRTWTSLPLPSSLRTVATSSRASYFLSFSRTSTSPTRTTIGSTDRYHPLNQLDTNLTFDAEIWSTHDGGARWSVLGTKSLGMKFDVLSVSASRGSIYAISWLKDQTFGLWRSLVTNDSWQRVSTPTLTSAAGGSKLEGALT